MHEIARRGAEAIKAVLAEFGLDKHGEQRVIEHVDEFAEAIRIAALASLKNLSVSDKFKDEEVASNCGYPSDYKPKGIAEQINRLRELFPGISFADEKIALGELPKHAEGWFAIPKWQTVAPIYGEAVEKVLAMINRNRDGNFYNFLKGQLGPDKLRQSAKSASMLKKLGDEQKDHDILIVPAQFGIRHRGRSIRRAREVFAGNEFGLGAFEVGIMLLTHPERLMNENDLWIDCAGDEYVLCADDVFLRAPIISFLDSRIRLNDRWIDYVGNNYGSASAFVQQK